MQRQRLVFFRCQHAICCELNFPRCMVLKKSFCRVFFMYFIYHTYRIVSWQFAILLLGEIGHQLVKVPLAYLIRPTQSMHEMLDETRDRDRRPHQELCLLLFSDKCVGSLMPLVTLKMQETGPMVYSPYLLKSFLNKSTGQSCYAGFFCCGCRAGFYCIRIYL